MASAFEDAVAEIQQQSREIDELQEENERFSILLNECFGVFDDLGIESKLRDAIVKALNDADDRVSESPVTESLTTACHRRDGRWRRSGFKTLTRKASLTDGECRGRLSGRTAKGRSLGTLGTRMDTVARTMSRIISKRPKTKPHSQPSGKAS